MPITQPIPFSHNGSDYTVDGQGTVRDATGASLTNNSRFSVPLFLTAQRALSAATRSRTVQEAHDRSTTPPSDTGAPEAGASGQPY